MFRYQINNDQFFQEAPEIRPSLNIGCLFDILLTGTYFIGKHGESILNGGLMYVTGVGGRGNTFKSTIAHFMSFSAMNDMRRLKLCSMTQNHQVSLKKIRSLSKKNG